MDKATLRTHMRSARKKFYTDQKSSARLDDIHRAIADHLKTFFTTSHLTPTHCWAGYRAFRDEVNIDSLFSETSVLWAFPRMLGDDIQFLVPQSMEHFESNPHGILEPLVQSAQPIRVEELSGVLVPGVAFDARGARLGYGKGYYDRALQNFKGKKIGVAYAIQITNQLIPRDATDICMDFIVTEKGVQTPRGDF